MVSVNSDAMPYLLLADAVLLLHLAFIAFVVAGALLVWRWPRLAWLHLPALAWGAYAVIGGAVCPLTPLENALRRRAGDAGYAGGFVEHYVLPILYPAGLTPGVQAWLGAFVVTLNAAIYAVAVARRRRARR